MPLRLSARTRWAVAGSAVAIIVAVGCSTALAANGSGDAASTAVDTSSPTPAAAVASGATPTPAAAAAPVASSSTASSSTASPSAASSAAPSPPPAGSLTPADILDVSFASGAPVDGAQGLAATTIGAPKVAADPSIGGANVATFSGSGDAYLFPFQAQWPKMANGFSYECVFRYNSTTFSSGDQAVCSDTNSGGADMVVIGGQLNFYIAAPKAYTVAEDPDQLTPGQWYIAVGSWNGTSDDLYVDGYLVASTPAATPLVVPIGAGAQNFLLGADANTTNGAELYSPVSIAAARVFSTGLTADQAKADAQAYNLYAPPPPPPAINATNVTAQPGRVATFSATLSDQDMTGLVTFQYDGIDIACQAVAGNGSATCTTRTLPRPGRYDVEVRYSGDLKYGPMSTDITLTVKPGGFSSGHRS